MVPGSATVSPSSTPDLISVSWSFAMPGLPSGQPRTMPSDLQAWSVRDVRSPAEADQLEDALRLSLAETARNVSS